MTTSAQNFLGCSCKHSRAAVLGLSLLLLQLHPHILLSLFHSASTLTQSIRPPPFQGLTFLQHPTSLQLLAPSHPPPLAFASSFRSGDHRHRLHCGLLFAWISLYKSLICKTMTPWHPRTIFGLAHFCMTETNTTEKRFFSPYTYLYRNLLYSWPETRHFCAHNCDREVVCSTGKTSTSSTCSMHSDDGHGCYSSDVTFS